MFNDDDLKKILNTNELIPDGVIDGSQYAQIIGHIIDYLSQVEVGDYTSGVTWVMRCVNECYDPNTSKVDNSRATDVATALAYVLLTMLSIVDEDDLYEFIRIQKDDIVPELIRTSDAVPYYDMTDEFSEIVDGMYEDDR